MEYVVKDKFSNLEFHGKYNIIKFNQMYIERRLTAELEKMRL